MLAVAVDKSMVPKLAGNGDWAFTQKLDGTRALIVSEPGTTRAFGRSGRRTALPLAKEVGRLPAGIVLDGELMKDGTLYLFDAPRVELAGTVLVDFATPYASRLKVLAELVRQVWPRNANIRPVPYATSAEHKLKLFKSLLDSNAEGIVARKMDSVYRPGVRSSDMVKIKFTKTADVFAIRFGDEGKDNIVLAVYDAGKVVEVGKVSALTGDGRRIGLGDVLEVGYLNFSADGRLIQPVNPRKRTDKSAKECLLNQFDRVDTHLIGVG